MKLIKKQYKKLLLLIPVMIAIDPILYFTWVKHVDLSEIVYLPGPGIADIPFTVRTIAMINMVLIPVIIWFFIIMYRIDHQKY